MERTRTISFKLSTDRFLRRKALKAFFDIGVPYLLTSTKVKTFAVLSINHAQTGASLLNGRYSFEKGKYKSAELRSAFKIDFGKTQIYQVLRLATLILKRRIWSVTLIRAWVVVEYTITTRYNFLPREQVNVGRFQWAYVRGIQVPQSIPREGICSGQKAKA